ncbi:hypothetical protein SAMN06265338_11451 [Rhodoblastus acidophilus]|uniref:Uncharacterized protein n=1 Tax=Rhodoblastus acidophilus TaxID=1074 RepID=A0A212S7A6_RHOAC|nr:hypothetical protein [Rhodoblastus acidophilus]MCW2318337.1 hypothetical protein [Rhodoblastus acidophilus]PPQ37229.1 hypothetical protein CKO16_14855 [Rhodoblastus acidophilus]RAI17303.1 hypothetical protein CH337_16960 [Rhodoblastus acidophilus]SNB81044.1 hypothetical protein SAMN06265338_11451 [Rhodoblastus acidophilus]
MDAQTIERRINQLLDDPMISLMIQADGVDRARLANQIRWLGRPTSALSTGVRKSRGNAARFLQVACGGCAP